MAGDTANPRVWLDADVYTAPLGSTAPTDVSSDWDSAWEPVGLLSEDGMTESRDETQTDHRAWGGILVRTTRSQHKRTFTVTALEDNPVVYELVNPGSSSETVEGTEGALDVTTREIVTPKSAPKAFGFELIDGDYTKRLIIPRGEIFSVGQVSASETAMSMYELQVTVYPAADGVLYQEITTDPAASGPDINVTP